MEVDTSDLDAQIAALQKAKEAKLAKAAEAQRLKDKEQAKILIGSTPTKASIRAAVKNDPAPLPPKPPQPNFYQSSSSTSSSSKYAIKPKPRPVPQVLPSLPKSGPSRMGSSLAALRRSTPSSSSRLPQVPISRSSGFEERKNKPSPSSSSLNQFPSTSQIGTEKGKGREQETGQGKGNGKSRSRSPELEVEDEKPQIQRDEDSLTIIEKLELGPKEFGFDPEGEEEWRSVEPNSGIRLSKRVLSHSHFQDHLSGRYFLTPSQIYSVIRLSKDGATYDIPVDGDWITIAVVAQRGEIKISGNREVTEYSDDDDEEEEEHTSKSLSEALKIDSTWKDRLGESDHTKPRQPWKGQNKKNLKGQGRKRVPRKYINYTLCSLPPRNRTLGKTDTTAGDALLQLLLFEADSVVRGENDENGEVTKTYRGGSGGAYERWCNLTEGNVIAILNPRVWRNLRGGSNGPHPLEFPLGLNPHSADSIILLGQAKDLGKCNAMQKDGNRCKTWVDLRQSQVCEYHVHAAIQRGKSGRAEFTASTSSFALTSRPGIGPSTINAKGKLGYDPKTKTGLLPAAGRQAAPRGIDNGGGGATYVVGGGVVNTGAVSRGGLKGFGQEYLSEKLGRTRSEKRKRQLEDRQTELTLQNLLQREGKNGSTGARYLSIIEKDKGKDKYSHTNSKISKESRSNSKKQKKGREEYEEEEEEVERKRPFNAEAIKKIGFDPTSRSGNRDSEDVQKRLDAIAALRAEEPGCRLERLSKKLEEEKLAKKAEEERRAKRLKEDINPPMVLSGDEEEEDMIDLD